YHQLKDCALVIECTLENIDIKKSVYNKIESVIE
ncbi:3-hydroxyacyl-CoA dehydrogenase family protein, partial [archaeon]